MAKKNVSPAVRAWGKYMKGKLVFARLMGLIFCLVCAGTLALLYFNVFDTPWIPMIMIAFSMACIFISNSFLQGTRKGKSWQAVNLGFSIVCYLAVITFVVLGFVDGSISFGF